MKEDVIYALTNIVSVHDDINLKVIRILIEIAKNLPEETKDIFIPMLRELLDEHKAARRMFNDLTNLLPNERSHGE